MQSLQDALYNWLTIKIVSDARPDDNAAKDTKDLFEGMLFSDHGLSNIEVTKDDMMYYISYTQKNECKKSQFPVELIEVLLNQINLEPEKYVNYPVED
ncbi:hypothetical protein ACF5W4_06095 [Bacillota bacterium Lsc_1132]